MRKPCVNNAYCPNCGYSGKMMPELLDLARAVAGLDHRYVSHSGPLADAAREWMDMARAAITKAEGRS